jgi:hypothetical protein
MPVGAPVVLVLVSGVLVVLVVLVLVEATIVVLVLVEATIVVVGTVVVGTVVVGTVVIGTVVVGSAIGLSGAAADEPEQAARNRQPTMAAAPAGRRERCRSSIGTSVADAVLTERAPVSDRTGRSLWP